MCPKLAPAGCATYVSRIGPGWLRNLCVSNWPRRGLFSRGDRAWRLVPAHEPGVTLAGGRWPSGTANDAGCARLLVVLQDQPSGGVRQWDRRVGRPCREWDPPERRNCLGQPTVSPGAPLHPSNKPVVCSVSWRPRPELPLLAQCCQLYRQKNYQDIVFTQHK